MGNKISKFLKDNKDLLKKLVADLNEEFAYASLLATDTNGTSFSVSRSENNVGDSFWCERGFVIRVFNGYNYSEYSFNSLDNLEGIKEKVRKIVLEDVKIFKNKGLELMEFPLIDEEEIVKDFANEYEINPFEITAEEKLAKLNELKAYGLSKDPSIVDIRVRYEEVEIGKLFLSKARDLSQKILYTNLMTIAIGQNNGEIKYDFNGKSGLIGYEIFKDIEKLIDDAVSSVLQLYKAERVKPGVYEVICDESITGLIAHEAFGHGVEMDMFVKNRAKGAEYMNKRVASDLVLMHDGAKSAEEVGTYLFDDEGTLGTDTLVIDKGILRSGISDLLSAIKLGTKPTGNGRRESFERKAYARMTNTFFEKGKDKLEDMIKSVKKGYLLEGYFSGMEDPKNWGIQCVLAKGKEIVNGEFTGKIISPITLTGYVPDLLESISMVSDGEVDLSGNGMCGKGHKEFVKTSTGGTYIKAMGRLS